jgi:hypothetical protein
LEYYYQFEQIVQSLHYQLQQQLNIGGFMDFLDYAFIKQQVLGEKK